MPSLFDSKFWKDEEDALWEAMAGLYVSAYLAGIDGGVNALPPELQPLVDFDLLNTNALDFAKKYRYDLISGINDTTRRQVQDAMTEWIKSGDPLPVLQKTLAPIFGKARANMIAVTEITRIFAEGNTAAWASTGFVTSNRWMTGRDDKVCPICRPRAGQVYPINDMANRPPAHIRCRCWLQPVVDVALVQKQIERILSG